LLCICFFFFFSSRRRHTRFSRDWSSDVCSSDLGSAAAMSVILQQKLQSAVFYRIITRLRKHGAPKLRQHGSFVRPIPGCMHKPSKAADVLIKTGVISAPLVH